MEIQLAMAPPISFPERLLFLGIGFLLGRLLTFRPRQESLSRRRIVIVSLFVIAFLTLDVTTQGQGFFALVGGIACGCLFFIPSHKRGQKWKWRKGWLILVCLITGPIIGAIGWKLEITYNNTSPLDRMDYLTVYLFIGSVCGLVVALMVAVANRGHVEQPSANEPKSTPSPK
jgi:hypothetical protein